MKNLFKEKAIEMRKQGISIIKIANALGVSKSSVSIWVRGILLSDSQKIILQKRPTNIKRNVARSDHYKAKRLAAQNLGRKKIRLYEPLYVAGCMLYWGEGSKNKNRCEISNSELPMLVLFKKFLIQHFDVSIDDLKIAINAYTDFHSEEEIKKYWLTGLGLPDSSLGFTLFNQYPVSSKKKKVSQSEWGTCNLQLFKTSVVQEIFGAIQEFGSFKNDKWLK